MELRTGTCVVRNFRLDDAQSLALNGNNGSVWLNLRDLFPHPYLEADAIEYIAMVLAQPRQSSFAVSVDDIAIGGIGLSLGHDIERRSAELGYWIGEPSGRWRRLVTSAKGCCEEVRSRMARFGIGTCTPRWLRNERTQS